MIIIISVERKLNETLDYFVSFYGSPTFKKKQFYFQKLIDHF